MEIVFDTIDGKSKIKIVGSILDLMISYKQIGLFDKEAGGVLIYREALETDNIVVEYATEPYSGDKRARCHFSRRDSRHVEIFNQLHFQYKSIYGYLGEWHTHPEKNPHYSWIDRNNWEKIANQNTVNESVYYHIIIGTENIGIWAFDARKREIRKVYEGETK